MSQSHETGNNSEAPEGVIVLCQELFEIAERLQNIPDRPVIGRYPIDGTEYIVLVDESQETTAYLSRSRNAAIASFPYQLTVNYTGFDLENNMPELVGQTYQIDHTGNFHSILQVDHRDVVVSIDPYVQQKWESFFTEASVCQLSSDFEKEL